MTLELWLHAALYLSAGTFALALILHRLRRSLGARAAKDPRILRSGARLGNALHQLQSIIDPQVRHAITEQLTDDQESDDANDPADPDRHLLRQAARIRRGDAPDRLTAILPRRNEPPA